MSITANLQQIKEIIGPQIKLIGVTKNRTPLEVNQAIQAGLSYIGENRVQEAQKKFPLLDPTKEKHLIGHLQSNKAKQAVELFDVIQSVDSFKLAKKLSDECSKQRKTLSILLQVNIANEPQKFGFTAEDVLKKLPFVQTLPHLTVDGLMAIVPYEKNPENTRPYFQSLRELKEQLKLKELSIGMSHDYKIAVQEGATMVRIGRSIFDPV